MERRKPIPAHDEKHFMAPNVVRDLVLGLSDGLTVPFALAAGLSGALASTHLIVAAGLAEIAAGSIAMGLGGYLAAKSDADHFVSERAREERETVEVPEEEEREVARIFKEYGLSGETLATVVQAVRSDRKRWVDFMMKFELGIEEPDPARARNSALTIAIAYILGGLLPLAPYILLDSVPTAFVWSVTTTLIALFVFGFIKGLFASRRPWRAAFETTAIGGLAAATAYFLARAVS